MTAIDQYFCLGGNLVVNRAATECYMRAGIRPTESDIVDCGAGFGLSAILGETYRLPNLDPAPWYDERRPESADFAGLLVTSAEASAPVVGRSFSSLVGHGSILGRQRLSGRQVVVTGFLIGRTCCATRYGLGWLTTALLDPCGDPCGGAEATFLTCVPSPLGPDHICSTGCDHGREGELSEFLRADPCGGDFWRTWIGVGLIDGPNVLSRQGLSCGGCNCSELVEVEFTLGVEQPWSYAEPTPIIEDVGPGVCQDIIPRTDCEGFADCADDPCPDVPAPPAIPRLDNPCVELTQPVSRICGEVTEDDVDDWSTAATIIEVRAGSEELRNFALRVWRNPAGFPCGDQDFLEECSACSTLYVTYVPPEGILRVDGVRRRITIECANSVRDATRNVFTLEGQPFDWIDLDCARVCICADFACATTADDASLSVFIVQRELA